VCIKFELVIAVETDWLAIERLAATETPILWWRVMCFKLRQYAEEANTVACRWKIAMWLGLSRAALTNTITIVTVASLSRARPLEVSLKHGDRPDIVAVRRAIEQSADNEIRRHYV
jgi:hypothetical protein